MSKIRLTLLSSLTILAVSAVASASASAVIMPAYSTITGSLKIVSKKTNTSTTSLAALKGTIAGVEILIECGVENGSGTVENTAADGLSLATVHYTVCKVSKPVGQNCLVFNGLVLVTAHDLLVLSGGKIRDQFEPQSGTTFTTIILDNCTTKALNGSFTVTGTAAAETNNANSSLEFSETSGENLKFGGNPAIYTDSVEVLMENGGAILVQNER
jgi:hypothetical protein